MADTKKVEATPKKAATDEATKPVDVPRAVPNAEIRSLAEESLNEENLTGTVEETEELSEPLSESSTDETTDTEPSDEDNSEEDSEEAEGTEIDSEDAPDDDLGDLLEDVSTDEPEETKKSGLEKRIDKLTKQNYEKEAEIARLKKLAESKESPETAPKAKEKYTTAQLVKALEKARDEGDTELEIQIMQHISDSKAEAVKAEYEAKEKAAQEANAKMQREWIAITDMFHYDEVEIYPGSQADLNIKDANSLVYRLSAELYQNQGFKDEENGMSKAVSEALRRILAKKKTSAKPQKSSNEKNLEKKVKKLTRKTSSPSGSKTVKADSQSKESKPKSDFDKVSEAISEKKKLNAWKY